MQLGQRDRPTEGEALRVVAAEFGKELDRFPVLGAFRDDRQAELMREIDGRAHHDAVALIAAQASHEHLVDLQLMDGQGLEVAQR